MKEEINQEEIWRPIIGYEEIYEVSNLGRVKGLNRLSSSGKRLQSKIKKPSYNRKKYLIMSLHKDGINKTNSVHRLVAKAFIPNVNNLPQVNHKDGIKIHNYVDNLEWVTNLENMQHAVIMGLLGDRTGEKNGKALSSNKEVEIIIERYNNGEKASEISKSTGFKIGYIREILFGKSWQNIEKEINKRDDRGNWSEDHAKNNLISKFQTNSKMKPICIGQYTKEGKEVAKYRSIKQAEIITGIGKSSISAVVHETKFYNKDKTKYSTMKEAGGYIWKKLDIDIDQFKKLI